jgi:hypothetical protein
MFVLVTGKAITNESYVAMNLHALKGKTLPPGWNVVIQRLRLCLPRIEIVLGRYFFGCRKVLPAILLVSKLLAYYLLRLIH